MAAVPLVPVSTIATPPVASTSVAIPVSATSAITVTPHNPRFDKNILYRKFHALCPDAVVFTVLPGFTVPGEVSDEKEPNLPFPLCEFHKPHYKSLSKTALTQLVTETFAKIKVLKEEASFLEIATRNQASCWEWHHYCKGLITASHFHEIICHSWRSYPQSIIETIMQYSTLNAAIPALKWGRENEDNAIKQYMAESIGKHVNLEHRCAGLSIDINNPFLGASPDGVISCDCCGIGLLEVKCTYKYRSVSPTCPEALSDKNYFLKKEQSGEVSLDIKHKYYAQVQAQLSVSEHPYCDFICWTTKGIIYLYNVLKKMMIS